MGSQGGLARCSEGPGGRSPTAQPGARGPSSVPTQGLVTGTTWWPQVGLEQPGLGCGRRSWSRTSVPPHFIIEFNLQSSLHATVPVTSAEAAFMCK